MTDKKKLIEATLPLPRLTTRRAIKLVPDTEYIINILGYIKFLVGENDLSVQRQLEMRFPDGIIVAGQPRLPIHVVGLNGFAVAISSG